MTEKKRPTGRPSKYDPKYCDMIIEHMEGGLSIESFGGVVDVSKSTIYEWIDNFSEFSDSVKTGTEKSRLFWEKAGVKGLFNRSESGVGSESFNTANWIFNMKNRFRDEWRDKQEVDHTTNGESINIISLGNGVKPSDDEQ